MGRYTVTRSHDSLGGRYATGPLTFVDTDNLAEAQREVHRRGGELIDHEEGKGWSPSIGWYDVDATLSR